MYSPMSGTILEPAPNPAVLIGTRGIGPTAPSPIAGDTVAAAFTLVVLLNGGGRHAEAAMLDGISRINPCRVSRRELFVSCASAALARVGVSGAVEIDEASSALPPELQRILKLPSHLRRCFVLRVLAGLSPEECARLNVYHADKGAAAAARQLARIHE